MKVCVLGSGSQGNATLVVNGHASICIDAGFKLREFTRRCQSVGFNPMLLSGIFISHDHEDHAGRAVEIAEALRIPIYGSPGTIQFLRDGSPRAGRVPTIKFGHRVLIHDIIVEPFTVPHDAIEPVGFMVRAGSESVAVCLDLGHISTDVESSIGTAEKLVIDCNHSREMLRTCQEYNESLRKRIGSDVGHLSNDQVSELLSRHKFDKVILAHLSSRCNDPILAATSMPYECEVSTQDKPTEWF